MDKEDMVQWNTAAAAAKSLQSCPTLCDPIDSSPPGSPIPGILQARTLEWVAISFSNAWKWKVKSEVTQSCPTLSNPMDCSLPGSSVHGILQARVLEWGAIAFSDNGILLSHKKEWNNAIGGSNMDATRDYHTKWSKSERDKYHIMPLKCGI